ncbi:hypothetical protein STCU_01766 [Strigomonas culicis]|uniref:Uncharacterized protein n=1 Tax=Strigomonas culicis TaxID=28005 RepID=S9WER2_9TRYP|nr:hypothetical protein STCU_01766 [Strigomonas culicis]|eukprot:EPY34205.1 hypothetical protein STCU_01766 [Strigomonas culicis]
MNSSDIYPRPSGGIDNTDLVRTRDRSYAANSSHTNAGNSYGSQIEKLVSGTLTTQAYTARLEELQRGAATFDEKLMNLTRLVKLSQTIQEEKDSELRRENEELRARLKRQEQLSGTLQQELDALRDALPGLVQRELAKHGEALAHTQQQRDAAVQNTLCEVTQELRETKEKLSQVDPRLRQVERAAETAHEPWTAELNASQQWTRRNMLRLKQHVNALSSDLGAVRKEQQEMSSTLQHVDCKAEGAHKRMKLLLQQKSSEADALNALLEKELHHVRGVARQHEILRDAELPTASANAFDDLKFAS